MYLVNKYNYNEFEVLESNNGLKVYFSKNEYTNKINEISIALQNMLNNTKTGTVKHKQVTEAIKHLEYTNKIVEKIMYSDFDIFKELKITSKGTVYSNRNIRLLDTCIKGAWVNQIKGTNLQLVLRHYEYSGNIDSILLLRIEFNYKHKTPSVFNLDNC